MLMFNPDVLMCVMFCSPCSTNPAKSLVRIPYMWMLSVWKLDLVTRHRAVVLHTTCCSNALDLSIRGDGLGLVIVEIKA